MILIIHALAREVSVFKRRLDERSPLAAGRLRGHRAKLGATDITLVASGIGHARALETARRAFEALPRPTIVLATGVSGALSAGLSPGDLVLADRLVTNEGERHSPLRIAPDHLERFEASLRTAGLGCATGAILTSRRVLATTAAKRAAKLATGAIAVDMESAAVASEAVRAGIPFACLRAIFDALEDELPAQSMVSAEGKVRPLAATGYLLRNPAVMLKVPRMMRDLNRATRSLADGLEAFCRAMA